jgi:hypothetical protein
MVFSSLESWRRLFGSKEDLFVRCVSLGLGFGGRREDSPWWARLDRDENLFVLGLSVFGLLKLELLLAFFLLVTSSQSPCRSLAPSSMLIISPLIAVE